MWETIVIQPFLNVLLLINSLVGNFGISIILFTLLVRLITHPLTVKQFKATQECSNFKTIHAIKIMGNTRTIKSGCLRSR